MSESSFLLFPIPYFHWAIRWTKRLIPQNASDVKQENLETLPAVFHYLPMEQKSRQFDVFTSINLHFVTTSFITVSCSC